MREVLGELDEELLLFDWLLCTAPTREASRLFAAAVPLPLPPPAAEAT